MSDPDAAFAEGLALLRAGRPEAADRFRVALAVRPGWAEAHYNLANILRDQGQRPLAAQHFRQALRARPDFPEAEVNLANLLQAEGKFTQAESAYRRVLRRHPERAELHNNLATSLRAAGDLAGAEASLREALRLRPDFAEAQGNLGAVLVTLGKCESALPLLRTALTARPRDAALHEALGDALFRLGQHDAAAAAHAASLALESGRLGAKLGRAEALRAAGRLTDALAVLEDAVAAHASHWSPHHDLGNVLRDLGRFAEAAAAYRAALERGAPARADTHLGAVLRDLHRLDEAATVLRRAVRRDPKDREAAYNLAITHLTSGRWAEGFAGYDHRFALFRPRVILGPAWTGERPHGKTILVHAEQGLGDTIQFARYVAVLSERGARPVFEVQPAIARLIATMPGAGEVIAVGAPRPEYDAQVPLMSLPRLLTPGDTVPDPSPYLHAAPDAVAAWRARLAALPGLRVGIAWAGNRGFAADRLRSLPPAMLAALTGIPGVDFVSLQKDAPPVGELPLLDRTGELADLADTAALIAALDLVVSVDTAVAHLAGALGVPVFLLNRFDSCWRWGVAGETSVWYKSLRQFRQAAPGDWSAPLAGLRATLAEIAAARASTRV